MAPVISGREAYDGEPSKKVHRSDHAPGRMSDETRAEHERKSREREEAARRQHYADILPDPMDQRWYDRESTTNDLDLG